MATSEEILEKIVSDLVQVKIELETLQMMRKLLDMAGKMYGSKMKSLDKAELEANEDLAKLSEITEIRMSFKEQEHQLDNMVKSVKEQEDETIPHAIELIDSIFEYANMN